jgi:hypothetical protein
MAKSSQPNWPQGTTRQAAAPKTCVELLHHVASRLISQHRVGRPTHGQGWRRGRGTRPEDNGWDGRRGEERKGGSLRRGECRQQQLCETQGQFQLSNRHPPKPRERGKRGREEGEGEASGARAAILQLKVAPWGNAPGRTRERGQPHRPGGSICHRRKLNTLGLSVPRPRTDDNNVRPRP